LGRNLGRIAVGAVAVLGGGVALPRLWSGHVPQVLGAALTAATAIGGYCLAVRITERQWPKVLRWGQGLALLAVGICIGTLLSVLAVGLLWLLGVYRIDGIASAGTWGSLLGAAVPICISSSVIEELLMRGVLLRQVARDFSRATALLISSGVFGAIHLANPGATLTVGIGLMVQAGLLLGLAYLLKGRLWLPIGLHFAWNFLQAGVFGGALSGNAVRAIVTAHLEGPAWISGGQFGIEGSLITTAVCLAGSVILILLARSRGVDFSACDATL
jgi:membrane protease YdiL (CAAX protease family)